MVPSAAVANDVLLIKVKDKPAKDLLRQIELAANATWKTEADGTLRLTRSTDQIRFDEARERQRRATEIRAELAGIDEILRKPVDDESYRRLANRFSELRAKDPDYAFRPYARLDGPFGETPIRRAMLRVLKRVQPEQIALLGRGDRLVFSNRPNRSQILLPAETSSILRDFSAEQTLWADAISKLPSAQRSGFSDDPLLAAKAVGQVPPRLILVASRSNSMALVFFNLKIVGADGELIGETSHSLANDRIRQASRGTKAGAEGEANKPLVFSNLSETLIQGASVFSGRGKGPGLSPAALAALAETEQNDPLGTVATDGLVALAEQRKADIVAYLPDSLFVFATFGFGANPTLETFLDVASDHVSVNADADGTLLVRPTRPHSARRERTDRTTLARYLKGILANGRATLDEQALYAFNGREADFDEFGAVYSMLLTGGSVQNIDADWPTLRLWGSLNPSQRRLLLSGVTIPYGELSQAQQRIVTRRILSEGPNSAMSGPGRPLPALWREPTEILPNGVTGEIAVSLKSRRQPVVVGSSTRKDVRFGWKRDYEPAEMGRILALQDRPNASFNPEFDRFEIADRSEFTLVYHYTPYIRAHETMSDLIIPAKSVAKRLDQLPEAVRNSISRAMKQASDEHPVEPTNVPPPL